MRIVKQDPCYCTECDGPESLKIRFNNPQVVQQATFALCLRHAEQLASMLLQHVRKAQR